MKFQDFIFAVFLLLLIYKKNPVAAAITGIICLFISIPLFARWIFFTAERLTWYAAGFFLLSIILYIIKIKRE